ncbi:MAG: hypothetical protein VKL42_15405 [Snowella sp.]|nr:hypothetical protein [Snowella sp.]
MRLTLILKKKEQCQVICKSFKKAKLTVDSQNNSLIYSDIPTFTRISGLAVFDSNYFFNEISLLKWFYDEESYKKIVNISHQLKINFAEFRRSLYQAVTNLNCLLATGLNRKY